MTKTEKHKWQFKPRFRRHAFGWKSGPPLKRIKEAVAEIKKVGRNDKILAAEGAITLIEKLSPALEHVDSSSGAIGTAVNNAIEALVSIIAKAPVDNETRDRWLERLFQAHADDEIPYIEILTDYWGELCVSKELAASWADRLVGITKMALSEDKNLRGHFHGTTACLSSLFAAERYNEIINIVPNNTIWAYQHWVVKALAAQGRRSEAIKYAEGCRNAWASDISIDRHCEEILLESDLWEEAYKRYGLSANHKGTYLAWFRAVCKKYPAKEPSQVLKDLVDHTPGEEGKWFAAAKAAKLYDEAIVLANHSPCSPQTLTRAARDFIDSEPKFSMDAGLAAIRWLLEGYGYEIRNIDVMSAYLHTMKAAEKLGKAHEIKGRISKMASDLKSPDPSVTKILKPYMEM